MTGMVQPDLEAKYKQDIDDVSIAIILLLVPFQFPVPFCAVVFVRCFLLQYHSDLSWSFSYVGSSMRQCCLSAFRVFGGLSFSTCVCYQSSFRTRCKNGKASTEILQIHTGYRAIETTWHWSTMRRLMPLTYGATFQLYAYSWEHNKASDQRTTAIWAKRVSWKQRKADASSSWIENQISVLGPFGRKEPQYRAALHRSMLFFGSRRTIPVIPWPFCYAPKAIPARGFDLWPNPTLHNDEPLQIQMLTLDRCHTLMSLRIHLAVFTSSFSFLSVHVLRL